MKKRTVFTKLKSKLETAYPQYEYVIRENALLMYNKDANTLIEALSVPILRYNKLNDKMTLAFPRILTSGKIASSEVKEYIAPSIDTYSLDYYNLDETHLDEIVENLFTGFIQKQVEKYEKMKKDFE